VCYLAGGGVTGLYWKVVYKVLGLTQRKPRKARNARDLFIFSDSYIIEHFARLGYAVSHDQLVLMLETVEDYADAREHLWHRPGELAIHELGAASDRGRAGQGNRSRTLWWSVSETLMW
jgi:hypothetical protein